MQMAKFWIMTLAALSLLSACGTQKSESDKAQSKESSEMADSAADTDDYKAANIAFLAENAKKEGWIIRESGLQYRVLVEGDGDIPEADDMVTVHYEGRLIDGTVFDSSYERGEPATFPANRLIAGWVEALSIMPVGSTWELAIPAELAYGELERSSIPPNSTLLFKLEMLAIKSTQDLINEYKERQDAYLAENTKKEGVSVTDSGLQYKVISEGSGASPTREDSVKVHYAGRLISGQEFDSSYARGEPIVFGVTQVIPGWTEALMLMKEGDKWEITLPHDIAYGERGAGADIPPYATLVFDVELLEVIKD